ncbi:DUF3307 domain-containing protein [Bacteroidota bacterium]
MENFLGNSGFQILIILFSAHLLGDFVFQTDKLIKNKKRPFYFITHIIIVAVLTYFLLGLWKLWYVFIVIAFTHSIIDYGKLKFEKKKSSTQYFFYDQGSHFLVLIILSIIITESGNLKPFWTEILGKGFIDILIITSGLILVLKVSGIIIGMLVKPLIKKIDKPKDSKKKKKGIKGIDGGGEIIGLLERLLIFFFILNGIWSAIGFLVAAKSVFRFGELKDRENRIEAEYILIGTLYSFSFGIVFSWLTKFALSIQ